MSGLDPASAAWFKRCTVRMRQAGIRRLLVLSGDCDWSQSQADGLRALLPGDWLWVGHDDQPGHIGPSAIRGLLGREFLHAVFDARRGLAADGLAALAGTLTAGSWLVILAPAWDDWPALADWDSLRWSEQPAPIATPNFVDHVRQSLQSGQGAIVIKQHLPLSLPDLPMRPDWHPPGNGPTSEQHMLLTQLLAAERGKFVLTAPRGRGKSTLAGMLAARVDGQCRVVAPARHAADVLARYADGRAAFFSPDAMLDYCRRQPVDGWLLVDEAAAIPMPLLRELIGYFPRVLLTTTVQGYEGTGRGFLLKFCAALPHWHSLRLRAPLRWADNDPLECWLNTLLLMERETDDLAVPATMPPDGLAQELWRVAFDNQPAVAPAPEKPARPPVALGSQRPGAAPVVIRLRQEDWRRQSPWLSAFYALLSSAHYRTSPLDLRRLMDAPGQHFLAAREEGELIGAVWSVDEGGLCPSLAHEVWAGRRRPPGNLVAQSLAAHGGLWRAPQLLSRRISRIAVAAGHRRRSVGLQLLEQARQQAAAEGRDYVSVSFGLTEELRRFWQAAGFELIHIGSHLEASSGCFSAMALLPLTDAGRELVRLAAKNFNRDKAWAAGERGQELNDDDWRTLAGFAFAHRPPEACRASLARLIRVSGLPLPALRHWLEQRLNTAEVVARLGLTGKKALLNRWRSETADALAARDTARCRTWRAWSAPKSNTTSDRPGGADGSENAGAGSAE